MVQVYGRRRIAGNENNHEMAMTYVTNTDLPVIISSQRNSSL